MATFTLLEPMSTGDVIDRAVRLYRRNFGPLISIVAVPALIGYVVKLMFSYGYSALVLGAANQSPNFSGDAVVMMIMGGIGYPVWLFSLLLTISGLSRVVGDNVMLNEPITFKRCLAAIRKRVGAITLMGLLFVVLLIATYMIVVVFAVVVTLLIGAVAGVVAAARLPSWLNVTLVVIVGLLIGAAIVTGALLILSRVAFMPQIVMIEGQGAAPAMGRSFTLGKGNTFKVGGIALFTYFIQVSLLAALTLPVLAGLYLSNSIGPDFFISQGWTVLYTSFSDLSGLLSLPIWIVSFTLLYFDSRVRKEAYDVELLAREVAPGFYWQPTVQPAAFGYPMVTSPGQTRTYVQTSPLGLAGWRPTQAPTPPILTGPEAIPVPSQAFGETQGIDAVGAETAGAETIQPTDQPTETPESWCINCGATLRPIDLFCMKCGTRADLGKL